jgi:hypothetical protein
MSTMTTESPMLCTAWPFIRALPFPLTWASAGSLNVSSLSLLRFLDRVFSESEMRGRRRGLRSDLRALAMEASGENMMQETVGVVENAKERAGDGVGSSLCCWMDN